MRRVTRELAALVPIVGDGAIGHPDIGDGRLLPVLILDCSEHKPLYDAILAQDREGAPPGDVTTAWSWGRFSKKQVGLHFDFERPVETSARVLFDVSTQGPLIDWIINARGVYLQPLSSGKSVSQGLSNPKMLVEVTPASTFPGWKGMFRRSVEKQYRKSGLTRAEAKEATDQHLKRMHEFQFSFAENESYRR